MRGSESVEYHRLRAAAELERAAEAADPKTADLHRQLARLHQISIDEDDALPRPTADDSGLNGVAAPAA